MSTNNFSLTNKLGEGGFGPVYKGELLNGQFDAVKRLSKRSGQGLEELKNETELIAKLQHRNLVGILGCCIEKEEKILVYECMPNKILDFLIFEATRKKMLDWTKRVNIIDGIAQVLVYLHHHSRLRINQYTEMNPKISDFVGTYGYMSPEYAMKGLFSVKSDVFAFGVLMLEIINGKNTGMSNMWKQDRALELVDPILEIPTSSSSVALRYIKIGLLCVQENPADRPLMSDVVAMLNNEEEEEMASPLHLAFTVVKTSAMPHKLHISSVNGLTLSRIEAR